MFFINSFQIFYKIVLLHFFSFFQGMQTRERAHFARSVFPFIKKKKEKKKVSYSDAPNCKRKIKVVKNPYHFAKKSKNKF